MLPSSTYLLLIFLLFTCSWSSVVEDNSDDTALLWNKTKYLTRSNWTTSLKPNTAGSKLHNPVWFIFHYLKYCGFCKTAKPGWEAAAQYAAGKNQIVSFSFCFSIDLSMY